MRNPEPVPDSRTTDVLFSPVSVKINPISLLVIICGPRVAFLIKSVKWGSKTLNSFPMLELITPFAFFNASSLSNPYWVCKSPFFQAN